MAVTHRRAGEQQRDARRDQRAEHAEQQHQRDRQRGDLGAPEVGADGVVHGPANAGLAGLGHPQAGMGGLDGSDGALRGDDRLIRVVRVAGDVERDQRGAAFPRDQLAAARAQRRLNAGSSVGHGAQGRGHLPDGPADLRVSGHGAGAAPGLDQDGFRGGLHHAGPVQHPLGPAGLAGVVAVQVLGAEHAANQHRAGDQQQPAEQRGLAVPGAPAGDTFHHRGAHGRARRASGVFPGVQQCVRAFHGSLTGLWPSLRTLLSLLGRAAATSGRPPDPG
jgi:hypothetical protein